VHSSGRPRYGRPRIAPGRVVRVQRHWSPSPPPHRLSARSRQPSWDRRNVKAHVDLLLDQLKDVSTGSRRAGRLRCLLVGTTRRRLPPSRRRGGGVGRRSHPVGRGAGCPILGAGRQQDRRLALLAERFGRSDPRRGRVRRLRRRPRSTYRLAPLVERRLSVSRGGFKGTGWQMAIGGYTRSGRSRRTGKSRLCHARSLRSTGPCPSCPTFAGRCDHRLGALHRDPGVLRDLSRPGRLSGQDSPLHRCGQPRQTCDCAVAIQRGTNGRGHPAFNGVRRIQQPRRGRIEVYEFTGTRVVAHCISRSRSNSSASTLGERAFPA
jgi:hypothetical protein